MSTVTPLRDCANSSRRHSIVGTERAPKVVDDGGRLATSDLRLWSTIRTQTCLKIRKRTVVDWVVSRHPRRTGSDRRLRAPRQPFNRQFQDLGSCRSFRLWRSLAIGWLSPWPSREVIAITHLSAAFLSSRGKPERSVIDLRTQLTDHRRPTTLGHALNES